VTNTNPTPDLIQDTVMEALRASGKIIDAIEAIAHRLAAAERRLDRVATLFAQLARQPPSSERFARLLGALGDELAGDALIDAALDAVARLQEDLPVNDNEPGRASC
jgi:hypothetical protein